VFNVRLWRDCLKLLPWKRNNSFLFYCWRICVAVRSVIINESFATKYSNSLYVLCCRQYGIHFGLHVNCALCLFDFKQILSFSTDFHNGLQYQISRKSAHLEPRWYMRTERRDTASSRSSLFTWRCLKQCLNWLLVYWIRINIQYSTTITYRNNKLSVSFWYTCISIFLLSYIYHYPPPPRLASHITYASVKCTLHTVTVFLLDLLSLGCEFVLELAPNSRFAMTALCDWKWQWFVSERSSSFNKPLFSFFSYQGFSLLSLPQK
jgi:hypothetical protein